MGAIFPIGEPKTYFVEERLEDTPTDTNMFWRFDNALEAEQLVLDMIRIHPDRYYRAWSKIK